MRVLAIETSCDDTAAAVVSDAGVAASVVASQDLVHGRFGGVVPELASRQHVVQILPVIEEALERAELRLEDIDAVVATYGPGLVGSLLVGLMTAKGIAMGRGIPFLGVNHLEGHLLSALLEHEISFPFVGLVVSGGHTSLYEVRGLGQYRQLGRTRDDAAGEAFDKAAKMLGLGYPGGRRIERQAREGDPRAIGFPRASMKTGGFDFSFSGLKTALRQYLAETGAGGASLPDVCASVQEAIVDMLVENTVKAASFLKVRTIVSCGGVSANGRLRQRLTQEAFSIGAEVVFPSARLCTDNAAMIGFAGRWRLLRGETHPLSLNACATLPLGEAAQ